MGIYNYETAAEMKARKKRKIIIIVSVLVVIALLAILIPIILRAVKYSKATKLIEKNDYTSAYELLTELGDYKDCPELMANIQAEYYQDLDELTVGETFYFGNFEQDNNKSNGAESIEWMILAKEDSRIFAISKYALDCQPYHDADEDVTWETCSLRAWLNDDFYNEAFNSVEQPMIMTSTSTADKNPVEPEPNPGNATEDKVFLLSINEAETYMTQEQRTCTPTAYAESRGAHTLKNHCWWWLRTPGYAQQYAAYVYSEGSLSYRGHIGVEDCDTIRPAMWIDLAS